MITVSKVKQLERKFEKVSRRKNGYSFVVRYVAHSTEKLLNKNRKLLSSAEIKAAEKENKQVLNGGGQIIYITSYGTSNA